MNYKLSKDEILRGKSSFNRVFNDGAILSGNHISILYVKDRTKKIGFAVTRKIRTAVNRNRYKRLLKEIYRLNKTVFPENMHLILFAKGNSDNFIDLQKDVLKIVNNLNELY